jgi:MFS family permease
LVPGSLSIIAATFHPDDRGKAIGAWSGLAGVASSIGPFLGGWLIDAVSWRLVFLINVPLAAAAIAIAVRHVPETRSSDDKPLDVQGALLVTLGLACLSYAAIERQAPAAALGVVAVAAFLWIERRSSHPMLPLHIFRSRQFTGANLTTLAVYAGLSGALFLVVLRVQVSLGYSALEAGAALVPFTILMLLLSPAAGQFGQRVGARVPMTIGPLVAGVGLLLFSTIGPGDRYVTSVFPAVVVFGLGMTFTVAPLTAAVLGSVSDAMAGVASGVNNAVARLAGLLAVAALPALAGIDPGAPIAEGLDAGFTTALRIAAAICALGGVAAALVVRETSEVRSVVHASPHHACNDPMVRA